MKKLVQLLCASVLVVGAFSTQVEAGGPLCPVDPICAMDCQDYCWYIHCYLNNPNYPDCTAPGMHEAIGNCAEACARPGCCL